MKLSKERSTDAAVQQVSRRPAHGVLSKILLFWLFFVEIDQLSAAPYRILQLLNLFYRKIRVFR